MRSVNEVKASGPTVNVPADRAAMTQSPAGHDVRETVALHGAAGNRATVRLLRRSPASQDAPPVRTLARCRGACMCGGKCREERAEETAANRAGVPAAVPASELRRLASAVGNRRFARLAEPGSPLLQASRAAALGASVVQASQATVPNAPVRAAPRPITVGPVGDAYEREADGVARWARRPALTAALSPDTTGGPLAPASVGAALASPSRPLESRERAHFESRLGVDLGGVRIHDGPLATQSAADMAALAYTVGSDVVLARDWDPGDPAAETVLVHELAHVVQDPAGHVLRRFPGCGRVLPNPATPRGMGPWVSEWSVRDFVAEQLEPTGDVVRELPIPGASAAPFRTDEIDDVINPQIIAEENKGFVDIAYHPYLNQVEFLELKKADWQRAVFAEWQVLNYVNKANDSIYSVQAAFQRRGHPYAHFTYATVMPASRYAPPQQPVEIDGQQVLLSWCEPGVMVFRALDVDNEDLLYCGISDKGHTDAFIERTLGEAESAIAKKIATRLALDTGAKVLIAPILRAIHEKLREQIRWLLAEVVQTVCATALELSAAMVLREFKRRVVDKALDKLIELLPGDQLEQAINPDAALAAAAITAAIASLGYLIWTYGPLILAAA
jgi:hypothetical protein